MHEQQVVVTDAEAMEIIDNRSKRMRLPTHRRILPEWEGDYGRIAPNLVAIAASNGSGSTRNQRRPFTA